ncbi:MAG: export transporter periplasmic protein LptC [Pseudomonadota bacterium]
MSTAWRRHRLWDHITIYLPVLLMAGLAMGSYWIVKSAPEPEPEAPAKPLVHEPDYYMRGFAMRDYHATGALRSEVTGQELRHYPDTRTLEVDQPRILTVGNDGSRTRATAHTLWANAEQTEFVLKQNARVERTAKTPESKDSLRFQSEHFRLDTTQRVIESLEPVLLAQGGNQITASRMHYSEKTGIAQFDGRVQARLAAQ